MQRQKTKTEQHGLLRKKNAPNPVSIVFQDAALKALLCPNSKQKVFAISVETAATFLEILFLQRAGGRAYLIFVIFFTRAKFLENKIYTAKTRKLRQNTQ